MLVWSSGSITAASAAAPVEWEWGVKGSVGCGLTLKVDVGGAKTVVIALPRVAAGVWLAGVAVVIGPACGPFEQVCET